jgi:2-keto-4-pentenoate hydratase/2-oxohepta-3-ene-1,7-dioic acid hydratase in catechol pathway
VTSARVLLDGRPALVTRKVNIAFGTQVDLFGAVQRHSPIASFDQCGVLALVEPSEIVAVGLSRAARVTGKDPNRQISDAAVNFFKLPSALLGHGGHILLPAANRVDDAAERCVVIVQRVGWVPWSTPPDDVLGCSGENDAGHRDGPRSSRQWVRPTGYDTFCIEAEIEGIGVLRNPVAPRDETRTGKMVAGRR